ncbi:ankyrin repeat-containing domain protein [Xylaria longipes]|nr:ankyrin repeat-containing domain protein [Xylaria longipes]
MLRRPNINPLSHTLYYRPHSDRICSSAVSAPKTSPLAQSILTKNTELIEYFSNAGVFESLHKGGRFEVALGAAAEIGDVNLVTRLLTSCPDLESRDMTIALGSAIEEGHEELALLLLEEGASAYRCGRSKFNEQEWLPASTGDLTLLAVRKGNKKVAQKLLSIGDRTEMPASLEGDLYEELSQKLWYLMDLDIMESYLSSHHCSFRHEIAARMHAFRFHNTSQKYIFDPETDTQGYIAAFFEKMCDSMLDSKLATVELLTTCLTTAVSQDNSTLAHKLIERGANALDENVLTYAMRRGTTGMFQLLLHNKNGLRPVVTKGLRTEVLKTAIEQGPNKLGITPLGVAIRAAEAEFSQEFGYNVARLLLEHRCDPNNTVRFCEGYSLPTNHTAMLEAIDVRNQKLVKLLIEYGDDVNLELRHLVRRTPLQKAAEKGDLAMVRLLLQHGADVNAKPAIAIGGTALQFAAISGNCDVACELLGHGALLYMPPPKIGGRWPIERAAEHGRIEMIQFLWKANEGTLFLDFSDNGFREKNFKKAMRLARVHCHDGCVELIAQLANLPVTATDIPPVISPIYLSGEMRGAGSFS